ncbi:MAG: HAMP domain-containing protein [Caldilineae bacterium]|nr:MAG: HAMP domain-containing protein [Caldilineae bacterium]
MFGQQHGSYSRLQRLLERAWALAGGVSVRTKILGIVLTLTTILGLGVTLQVRAVMERVFIVELESRGVSVASDLAARSADPILLNDNYALYQLLTETVANHPDALYAYVLTPDGEVLVHTFGDAGFPVGLLNLEAEGQATDSQTPVVKTVFQSEEGIVHDFAAPIFEGRSGTVHLGLTETRLHSVINAVTGQMLLTTLAVAVVGILAAMLLTWLLTRPILDLVSTTREVGKGNLSVRAPHWADDEIGDLADAFNQMVSDLESSRQALWEKEAARTRLLEQLITAQEEERKRIARELHDGVGQSLTSLIVGMKLAHQVENGAAMEEHLAELRRFATATLEQVRLLSRQLRPSVLDDLGLSAALERYCEEFEQLYPGIMVDVHCDLPERLPPPVETSLYRIIQEAMTNAARHSGCSTISVLVLRRNGSVQAIIEDDGRGFDPAQARREGRSVGIHGMAERAELVGGHMDIESSSDGTTVYVEVPVEEPRDGADSAV